VNRPVALVREIPNSFTSAVTSRPVSPPLDADLARAQHHEYAAVLEAGGFAIIRVPTDERHPDCGFIEDAAVVVGRRALLTRPGHPSRRGEPEGVGAVLSTLLEVESMTDGSLDGGDVLQAGGRVFVGVSARTDAAGVQSLREFCAPIEVVAVPVRAALHLKSGVSAISEDTVLWHPAACDRRDLVGLDVIEVPGDDPEAANVVRLPDGSILVGAHQRVSAEVVASRGLRVRPVDVSEFARADGGLTCLSLRLRAVTVVSSAS
jgi:dimethylargininase